MKTLGITGGIGSGKSYVSRILYMLHDIPVFNCDIEVKRLINDSSNLELTYNLVALCGDQCYKAGAWNPAYIATLIEKDKDILDRISSVVKPFLIEAIKIFKKQHEDKPFCAIESALFGKSEDLRATVDLMIMVTAPLDLRIQRIKQRDPRRSDNEIISLLYNQISPKFEVFDTIVNGPSDTTEVDLDVETQINGLINYLKSKT